MYRLYRSITNSMWGKQREKNVPHPCLIPLSMGSQDDHSELGLDRNPKL